MEKISNNEIAAMLVVIYKRLEDIEYKIKGGFRSAPINSYLEDLRKHAQEVSKYMNE